MGDRARVQFDHHNRGCHGVRLHERCSPDDEPDSRHGFGPEHESRQRQRSEAGTKLFGEQPELLLFSRALMPIEIATLSAFWAAKYNLQAA